MKTDHHEYLLGTEGVWAVEVNWDFIANPPVRNKTGGLWFASHWNGTTTLEKFLAGGNLIVH